MAGLKVKKGDRVRILQGKDRGKEGQVSRVIPETGKVIVDGLNVVKKHQRATRATMQGGICLLYTSPSPRDGLLSRMPSSA